MKRILLAAAILFAASPVHAEVVSKEKLACIHIKDAKRLADFYSTPDAPNFSLFIFGGTLSGDCVWWQKGDKVIVSPKDYGDVVLAKQSVCPAHQGDDEGPDEHCSTWLYFDRCALEGSDADVKYCPSF
jgi:hypothetical protein